MNELDAIQEQMAWLGIDMSNPQQEDIWYVPEYDMGWAELSDEELAMFGPWGELDVSQQVTEAPSETPEDVMPEYDIEELKIDISPMLSWLPKEELADLIIWIGQEWNNFNSNNEANNA